MTLEMPREMNKQEKDLLGKLLASDFPGRDELSQQLENAKVQRLDMDGSLRIQLHNGVVASHVKYGVPTEGEYEDPDGITVHVLLFVRGGRAEELEFYREDNAPVQSWPNLDALRVFAPP